MGAFAIWLEINSPDSIWARKDAKSFFWSPQGGLHIGYNWADRHTDMLGDEKVATAVYGNRKRVDYDVYNAPGADKANLVRNWMRTDRSEAQRFAVLGRVATDLDGVQKVAFWNKTPEMAKYIPTVLKALRDQGKSKGVNLRNDAQVFYPNVPVKTAAEYIGEGGPDPQADTGIRYGNYDASPDSREPSTLSTAAPGQEDWSTKEPEADNGFKNSCGNLPIDINGEPSTLGKLVGDLHMVKGDRLAKMQASFCQQSAAIKNQIDSKGCDPEFWQTLHSKLGCDSMTSRSSWDRMVSQGRSELKSRVQNVLSRLKDDPEAWDREIGDDLLDAWRKGESFKGWLTRRGHGVPPVRSLQEEVPAPARPRRGIGSRP